MRYSYSCCIGFLLLFFVTNTTRAVERAFEFTGIVENVFFQPFGKMISESSPVSGGFIYDSISPGTHFDNSCDCTGYRHEHINGFWANFDGVLVQADEYMVEILNDITDPTLGTADIVTFRFSSTGIDPPLALPLLVDGVPEPIAIFSLTLKGQDDAIPDSTLPHDINPSDFVEASDFNPLFDEPLSLPNVSFSLSSFTKVSSSSSDHNLDGFVSGSDFLIWQRYFGETSLNGDADSDMIVDGSDLALWQLEYSSSLAQTRLPISVPEPSGGLFSLLIVVICIEPLHLRLS